MWFIGVEAEQETSAPPPEKNPGSAPDDQIASFQLKQIVVFSKCPVCVFKLISMPDCNGIDY